MFVSILLLLDILPLRPPQRPRPKPTDAKRPKHRHLLLVLLVLGVLRRADALREDCRAEEERAEDDSGCGVHGQELPGHVVADFGGDGKEGGEGDDPLSVEPYVSM